MIKKLGKRPFKALFYGTPKIGKTTLASKAPNPVLICCEDGAREVEVDAWEFSEGRVVPDSLEEFRTALKEIAADPQGHQTLVCDGIDAIERLCQKYMCAKNPKWGGNWQHEGYGRPEALLLSVWREVVLDLERVLAAGLNVILIGHSRVEKFSSPDTPTIDRYQISVTSHKQGDVAGFLSGWVDVLGFCKFEPMLIEEGKRTRGVGIQGARLMYLQRTDSFDAGCRYKNAPAVIPLSWSELEKVMQHSNVSEASVRAQITELIPRMPEEKRAPLMKWLETAGLTLDNLVQGLDSCRAQLMIETGGNK